MNESFTLTISGNSSVLEADYFALIELSSNKTYALGLVKLLTVDSISNLNEEINEFHISNHVITILPSSYIKLKIIDNKDYFVV